MEINVLIKTDMDEDYNSAVYVEGVYTNLARKNIELEWVAKGKELVPKHINQLQEYYDNLKSGKVMGENIPAIQAMRKKRMELYAYELGKLESIYTDEEYKKYYARCQGLGWQKYSLVE